MLSGGWPKGRVLSGGLDGLSPVTGGCDEDPLEDGCVAVALSDSSSELDRTLCLEMHKMYYYVLTCLIYGLIL